MGLAGTEAGVSTIFLECSNPARKSIQLQWAGLETIGDTQARLVCNLPRGAPVLPFRLAQPRKWITFRDLDGNYVRG